MFCLKPFVNPSKKQNKKNKEIKKNQVQQNTKKVSLQLQYKALQYKKGKQ